MMPHERVRDEWAVPGPVQDEDRILDPLRSDEPINIAGVRADEELINALVAGDFETASEIVGCPCDPLTVMLAAWVVMQRSNAGPTALPIVPARPSFGSRPSWKP